MTGAAITTQSMMILLMAAPKRMSMMLWIYGFTVCESVHRMSWSNNQDGHVEEGNEEPADTRQTARASQAREMLLPVAHNHFLNSLSVPIPHPQTPEIELNPKSDPRQANLGCFLN